MLSYKGVLSPIRCPTARGGTESIKTQSPRGVQEVFIESCMSFIFYYFFLFFCEVFCLWFLVQGFDTTVWFHYKCFSLQFFLNIQFKRVSRSGFLTVFGKILAFVPAYFSVKIWIKKVLRKGFLTVFGKILVFVPAFGETLMNTHQTWRKMTLK